MTGPDGRGAGPAPDPGHEEARRILQEAVRLVDLFGSAVGGLPPGHGGETCRGCPVCRLMSTLRELRPEVLDHLGAAAAELLAAAREFAASPGAGPADRGTGPADRGTGPADRGTGPAGPAGDAPPPADHDVPLVAARPRPPGRAPVQRIEITD